jgi:hypothetical protein
MLKIRSKGGIKKLITYGVHQPETMLLKKALTGFLYKIPFPGNKGKI